MNPSHRTLPTGLSSAMLPSRKGQTSQYGGRSRCPFPHGDGHQIVPAHAIRQDAKAREGCKGPAGFHQLLGPGVQNRAQCWVSSLFPVTLPGGAPHSIPWHRPALPLELSGRPFYFYNGDGIPAALEHPCGQAVS